MLKVKKISLLKIDITSILYCIWFFSYEFLRLTTISDLSWSRNLYFIICFTCLIIQLYDFCMRYQHSMVKLVIILMFSVFALISSYFSKSLLIVQSFWLIGFSCKINFYKTIERMFYIRIIVLILTSILALSNIININTIIRSNGVVRYSLGFNHPNRLSALILSIIVSYTIFRWNKLKFYHFFIFIIIAYIVNELTDSKSTVISICVLALVIIIFKYINNSSFKKIISFFIMILTIMLPIISLYMAIFYNQNDAFWVRLNNLFSGRIMLSNTVYTQYGLSVFGQYVDFDIFSLNTLIVLDNAYVLLMIKYGIVMLLFIEFIYIFIMRRALKRKEYVVICACFIFALHGLMESSFINLAENFMFIYFINILSDYSHSIEKTR